MAAACPGLRRAGRRPVTRAGFDWRYPARAAGGAFVLFLPLVLVDPDLGALCFLLLAAIISLALLGSTATRSGGQRLSLLASVVAFVAASWILVLDTDDLRSSVRWIAFSHVYKQSVLAQPAPTDGSLRHIAWQATGFMTMSNNWYLVYDPGDAMAPEVRRRESGQFTGIPCAVPRARKLEPHWYWVRFYTDEEWNDCGAR
jgi:hypothetical protein